MGLTSLTFVLYFYDPGKYQDHESAGFKRLRSLYFWTEISKFKKKGISTQND